MNSLVRKSWNSQKKAQHQTRQLGSWKARPRIRTRQPRTPQKHHNITTKPKLTTEPSNHNRMSSHHVKSFSNIRIDLLAKISVTFATSHWLRSPLKAELNENTIAKKRRHQEGRLHSQVNTTKNATIPQITYIIPPNPPRGNILASQLHVQVTLRHPQTYESICDTNYKTNPKHALQH
jgi:hypothetical protein